MLKFKPLNDRILVKVIEEGDKIGSLYIPDTSKEQPQEGTVLAVGEGKWVKNNLVPLSVNPKDKILFGKYAGTEIKIENKEYLILREEDVLGILLS